MTRARGSVVSSRTTKGSVYSEREHGWQRCLNGNIRDTVRALQHAHEHPLQHEHQIQRQGPEEAPIQLLDNPAEDGVRDISPQGKRCQLDGQKEANGGSVEPTYSGFVRIGEQPRS